MKYRIKLQGIKEALHIWRIPILKLAWRVMEKQDISLEDVQGLACEARRAHIGVNPCRTDLVRQHLRITPTDKVSGGDWLVSGGESRGGQDVYGRQWI